MTDDRDGPERPDPEVEKYSIERTATGDVQKVSVSVSYWNEDHERLVDVRFSVHDGRAVFRSQKMDISHFDPRRDLVPLIVASDFLAGAYIDGIDDVQSVRDLVDVALNHAERSNVER